MVIAGLLHTSGGCSGINTDGVGHLFSPSFVEVALFFDWNAC